MGLMRVLLVTTSFPSGPDDAAGPFVLRLMEALEEKDINCHVLTPASISGILEPLHSHILPAESLTMLEHELNLYLSLKHPQFTSATEVVYQ